MDRHRVVNVAARAWAGSRRRAAAAALLVVGVGLGAPAFASHVWYFRDSPIFAAGDAVWNFAGWHVGTFCAARASEYMDTLPPPEGAACDVVQIPNAPPFLGTHTRYSLDGTYPAGVWRAYLYIRGAGVPAGTQVIVRLFEEDGGGAFLCSGRVFLGAGVADLAGNYNCARVIVPIDMPAVDLDNQRIFANIQINATWPPVSLCWDCSGSPSRLVAPGPLAARFSGGGGKDLPAASPTRTQGTWGGIKNIYGGAR